MNTEDAGGGSPALSVPTLGLFEISIGDIRGTLTNADLCWACAHRHIGRCGTVTRLDKYACKCTIRNNNHTKFVARNPQRTITKGVVVHERRTFFCVSFTLQTLGGWHPWLSAALLGSADSDDCAHGGDMSSSRSQWPRSRQSTEDGVGGGGTQLYEHRRLPGPCTRRRTTPHGGQKPRNSLGCMLLEGLESMQRLSLLGTGIDGDHYWPCWLRRITVGFPFLRLRSR